MKTQQTECLIIRADASPQIGTGHIMRCLALAQRWRDGRGIVVFVIARDGQALEARLRSEGMKVIYMNAQPGSRKDAVRTARLAKENNAHWLALDGYQFGADYQLLVKSSGVRLLFLDDFVHVDQYYADLVLNQNIDARKSLYRNRPSHAKLLLGTKYVLLRREFIDWQGWKRNIPDVARRVLVTLGGADYENNTLKVLRAIRYVEFGSLEVVVVVGGLNQHASSIQEELVGDGMPARLVRNSKNMADLMAWADVAICTASTTIWELFFMGLPSVVGVSSREQESLARTLQKRGLIEYAGRLRDASTDELASMLSRLARDKRRRKEMITLTRRLVDGRGPERILQYMSV